MPDREPDQVKSHTADRLALRTSSKKQNAGATQKSG